MITERIKAMIAHPHKNLVMKKEEKTNALWGKGQPAPFFLNSA